MAFNDMKDLAKDLVGKMHPELNEKGQEAILNWAEKRTEMCAKAGKQLSADLLNLLKENSRFYAVEVQIELLRFLREKDYNGYQFVSKDLAVIILMLFETIPFTSNERDKTKAINDLHAELLQANHDLLSVKKEYFND